MAAPIRIAAGTGRATTLGAGQRYPEGRVEFDTSLAKPGDVVELTALMDLIVAVSACPMDLNPISGHRVHDLEIEVE